MKRIISSIGDVFVIKLSETSKKYFQYVANDLSQLNSSVIRAFKKEYPAADAPNISEIIEDEVDFYAHTVLRSGMKNDLWQKVGNAKKIGIVDVYFRDSRDYGNPTVTISNDWWVWKINEPFKDIGKLEGAYKNAEIGVIMTANDIITRLRTGKYPGFYPAYE